METDKKHAQRKQTNSLLAGFVVLTSNLQERQLPLWERIIGASITPDNRVRLPLRFRRPPAKELAGQSTGRPLFF